ncbi:WD repeat and SOCS box-containing protein 1 [Ceratobasidium sp. AG-Ba]|nr:WD repeat and SOCS box-containing protein 1 [Ceratobasidium sp. AG-Ba]
MASLVRTIQCDDKVCGLAVTPENTRVIAGCGQNVVVWDIHTGQKVLGPLQGHSSTILSIAVSPDGRSFASGSMDRTIRIWDVEGGLAMLQPLTGHTGWVRSVRFSPDGCLVVSGSDDSTIRFWDAHTGLPAGQPIKTENLALSIAMSSDGTRIAAACYDKTVRTYDATTRAPLFQYRSHTSYVITVAFSPDGRLLASGSRDCTICMCDAATGSAVGDSFEGHTNDVESVAFSPDGRYIASGSGDNNIRLWDAGPGRNHPGPLSGHRGHVEAVAFTPDGQYLVSGSRDETINIWDMQSHVRDTQNSQETRQDVDIEITNGMSLQDILSQFNERGCIDISRRLNRTAPEDHSNSWPGDVYRCKLETGAEVAVKASRITSGPNEQNRELFQHMAREMRMWSTFRHDNVQVLLGLADLRGQMGLVTTWEPNGSLPGYLERHPEADRYKMSSQIADGLVYLHESNVPDLPINRFLRQIHGDLKGANVLVSSDGVARISGFGSALHEYMLQCSDVLKDMLSTRWAAPELFKENQCTKQSDVYALGMTIMEIITGTVPWSGRSVHNLMFAVAIEKASPERPMNHIPLDSPDGDILWTALKSCWRFEPKKRPRAATLASVMKGITKEGLVST